jgi:hypothetical protein
MSSIAELVAAYPTIPNAVSVVETHLWASTEPFLAAGATPAQIVWAFKTSGDNIIAKGVGPEILAARTEMERPEFLTYVAGKMGAF